MSAARSVRQHRPQIESLAEDPFLSVESVIGDKNERGFVLTRRGLNAGPKPSKGKVEFFQLDQTRFLVVIVMHDVVEARIKVIEIIYLRPRDHAFRDLPFILTDSHRKKLESHRILV